MKAKKSRKIPRRWFIRIIGGVLIAFGCVIRVADPYPIEAVRLIFFDYLQRVSPRPLNTDLPVRVVDVDEASLTEIGQWPWPRTITAKLVERLASYGAASVSFDMLFAEPDRYSPARLSEDPTFSNLLRDDAEVAQLDNDIRFAEVISRLPVALGVAARVDDTIGEIAPKVGIIEIGEQPTLRVPQTLNWTPLAPPLDQAAQGIGGVNVSPLGEMAIVRSAPLVWRGPTGVLPGLSIEALRLAMGEQNIFIDGALDESGVMLSLSLGPFNIPTTEAGHLWLYYRHDDPFLYLSAADILRKDNDEWLKSQIEGRIILVGTSAAGLLDIRETPLGRSVPGVSIHAQVIEQILEDKMLRRSDNVAALELIAFIALGLIVTSLMSISGAVGSFLGGGAAAAFVLFSSWIAFQNSLVLFDATFPMIGGMVNFGVLAGYLFSVTERDKKLIKRSFSHYVAPEILKEMEDSGEEFQLGGETQDISVMFADLRDFTSLSETMSAMDLVTLLNNLFTALGDEILAEHGTIDKFIGDSIMAFWNAPMKMENHPQLCARAALRMRSALANFNASRQGDATPAIAIAVGGASGRACVGNIGSQSRFNYTVIGDVVNVASRIEATCRHVSYDILVSENIALACQDELALLVAGTFLLKGKSAQETVFIVVGDENIKSSDEFEELQRRHAQLIETLQEDPSEPDLRLAIRQCTSIAVGLEPRLAGFYERIADRTEDFSG